MKLHIAILATCATALALPAGFAHAQSQNPPIPGIDVVIQKKPSGASIKVGDCQSGGGKVVKQGTQWVCTGLPAPAKQKTPSR